MSLKHTLPLGLVEFQASKFLGRSGDQYIAWKLLQIFGFYITKHFGSTKGGN